MALRSDEDAEKQEQQSQLINKIKDELSRDVDYVVQLVRQAGDQPSENELNQLAIEISKVADTATIDDQQLLAAGIQDGVYAVKACKSVHYYSNEAVQDVHHALASDSPTDIRGIMQKVYDHMTSASSEIHGV